MLFLAVGIANVTNAQIFGSPKDEQARLASFAQDAERLSKITKKLSDIQKQRTISLAPIERKPQFIVEKWKNESDALSSYIGMFSDIHGSSIVLLNAVALSLNVKEQHLPPFYLGSICFHMPGEAKVITHLAKDPTKKGVLVTWYRHIGENILEPNEMNIALEGLQLTEKLAHSFNSLCNRASKIENWNK